MCPSFSSRSSSWNSVLCSRKWSFMIVRRFISWFGSSKVCWVVLCQVGQIQKQIMEVVVSENLSSALKFRRIQELCVDTTRRVDVPVRQIVQHVVGNVAKIPAEVEQVTVHEIPEVLVVEQEQIVETSFVTTPTVIMVVARKIPGLQVEWMQEHSVETTRWGVVVPVPQILEQMVDNFVNIPCVPKQVIVREISEVQVARRCGTEVILTIAPI